MSAKDFSLAIGEIDDKYIMEAFDYTVKTANGMAKRSNRKWVLVAALVAALLLMGFTIAPIIVEMINGRTVEWDENGLHTSGTATNMAEVRDGRVYFTLDNSDITEYCSETTYFRYDYTDEQGISHVILIGGEVDGIDGVIDNTIGWAEILFFEDGKRLSHSNLVTDGNDPEWYVKGNAEVNEDYGYVPPKKDGNYSYEIEIEPEIVED